MKIYTIRDQTVEAYLQPFFARNHNEAIRLIVDTASDQNTVFFKHPGDFTLYYIAEFQETTGEIFPADHITIGKIVDLIGPFNEESKTG